jgi:D-alanine-D-alanine ligase
MELRLLYNLRNEHPAYRDRVGPQDLSADWDTQETIQLLEASLRRIGFDVVSTSYAQDAIRDLVGSDSLVFSICEMLGGAYREALVPSLCETLKLPYVFSSPDVMVKTLDKNICNLIISQAQQSVPNWIYIQKLEDIRKTEDLNKYPYIVKPASEGSGMGVSDQSVVHIHCDLLERVQKILYEYKQPVIVQEYVEGLELTVGVLGENEIEVLAPIEIKLLNSIVYGFEQKENSSKQATYTTIKDDFVVKKVREASKKIYSTLSCRDAARIDFRYDPKSRELYFIEINPLPHLHPEIGDFCRSAYGVGYSYEDLLSKICRSAIERNQILLKNQLI